MNITHLSVFQRFKWFIPLCQAHLDSCSQMWPAFSSGWRVINIGASSLSSSLLFLVASPRYTWQNCKILKCTLWLSVCIGSPLVLKAKYLPANAGDRRDVVSIPGLARSPGGGNGNPLPYSCLDNFMDWGAWQATVHGVEKELDTTEELSTVCVHCDYLICVCAEVFTSCCSEVSACWMPTPRLGSAACCDMVPPPCSEAENTFPRTFFPGEFWFRGCKRETRTKLCCLSFLPRHQTVRSPGMGWGQAINCPRPGPHAVMSPWFPNSLPTFHPVEGLSRPCHLWDATACQMGWEYWEKSYPKSYRLYYILDLMKINVYHKQVTTQDSGW